MPIASALEAASELGAQTHRHTNTQPPACDSRHAMMLPGAGRMAVTSEKRGEPWIRSVLLSWQMNAVVDVLTRCKASALDTAVSPPARSFSVHVLASDFRQDGDHQPRALWPLSQ